MKKAIVITATLSLFTLMACSENSSVSATTTETNADNRAFQTDPLAVSVDQNNPSQTPSITVDEQLKNDGSSDALQEDLTFDSHVIAFSGNLNEECRVALGKKPKPVTIEHDSTTGIGNIVYDVDPDTILAFNRNLISTCFAGNEFVAEVSEGSACKYYLVSLFSSHYGLDHTVTKVAKDSIQAFTIYKSDIMTQEYAPNSTYFLVEDCENIIDENTQVHNRGIILKN